MYDLYVPVGLTDLHQRVIIMALPPSYRPARVRRYGTVTIIAVDPRSTKREVAEWAVDNLTVEEQNAGRAAYGQPPVGQPLADHWLDDDPYPTEIPAAIRLP